MPPLPAFDSKHSYAPSKSLSISDPLISEVNYFKAGGRKNHSRPITAICMMRTVV